VTDIQLQQSIISAQKETVLKSKQKAYEVQKISEPVDQHMVHTHAGTVLQHRAMLIKHYELIQLHKKMVKEQGLHVQNLTSALLNIQQETNVVDELMNTKMAENRNALFGAVSTSRTCEDFSMDNIGPSMRNGKTKRLKNKTNSTDTPTFSPDVSNLPHVDIDVRTETDNNTDATTITTRTSTITTTQTLTTTETTTISSTTTPTSTTTTATTTTTTTNKSPCPSPSPPDDPLPLSP